MQTLTTYLLNNFTTLVRTSITMSKYFLMVNASTCHMHYTLSMNKHVYNNGQNLFSFLLWLERTQTISFASVVLMIKLNYWKHHMSSYSTSSIIFSNTSSVVCHTLVSTRSQWMYYHGSFHHKWGRCLLLILKMP